MICWGRAPRTSPGCSPPSPVTDGEVLAFDLYGTLVDPIGAQPDLTLPALDRLSAALRQ